MYQVHNEYGPVEDFDTREEAEKFADEENLDAPNSHWVLYTYTIGGSGYPRG